MLGLIQAQHLAPALMALESVPHDEWKSAPCGSCNYAIFYVAGERPKFQCERIRGIERPPSDCSRWVPMVELLETHQQAATEALEARKQASIDALVALCQQWGDPDRSTLCSACLNRTWPTRQCRIGINISAADRVDGYPICQGFLLDPEIKSIRESLADQ